MLEHSVEPLAFALNLETLVAGAKHLCQSSRDTSLVGVLETTEYLEYIRRCISPEDELHDPEVTTIVSAPSHGVRLQNVVAGDLSIHYVLGTEEEGDESREACGGLLCVRRRVHSGERERSEWSIRVRVPRVLIKALPCQPRRGDRGGGGGGGVGKCIPCLENVSEPGGEGAGAF